MQDAMHSPDRPTVVVQLIQAEWELVASGKAEAKGRTNILAQERKRTCLWRQPGLLTGHSNHSHYQAGDRQ
jgi:hypothetical protein